MANTFKFGAGNWAVKEDYALAYNDENGNFKPLPFDFTRASSATRVNKDGLIETVPSGKPRIDFTDNTSGHLLLEPSRTNSLPYSNEFTNAAWSKLGAGTGSTPIVTANYGISPDGTQNADRLQLDKGSGTTTSDYSFLYDTVSSVGTGSISIWMKSNDSNTYQVALRMSNYVVCDVTPNWQRFELNNQASTNEIQVMLRGTYGTSDSADILIYGAQLEAGSYATSYIPTSGSSVTRVLDEADQTGVQQVIGQTEGTLYLEFVPLDASALQILFQIRSSSGSVGQIDLRLQSGSIRTLGSDGGSTQFSFSGGSYTVGTTYKVAVRYKTNDTKLYINGSSAGSDTSCSFTSSTKAQISFSENVGSNFHALAKIKDARLYDTALSDSDLQALTS